MKKLMMILSAFSVISFSAVAQYENPEEFANTITQEDLTEYLTILASDAMEGRDTGKRGQKMAAAMLRYHYMENGLTPGNGDSYYQSIGLQKSQIGEAWIKVGDETFKNYEKHIVYWGSENMDAPKDINVVFAGEGEEADYEGINAEGKGVIIMIANSGLRSIRTKSQVAVQKGATKVFAVVTETDEDFTQLMDQYKMYFAGSRLSLPAKEQRASSGTFMVSPTMAAKMLGTKAEKLSKAVTDGKVSQYKKFSGSVSYSATQSIEVVESENVLGYIEGTDKKDELVIVTSHYDHVGRNGDDIYNGADDDGSGTVAVMEIAQAFAEAKKAGKGPRRSMLFMNVTGEEKGLLGSEYYVNNPVYPLENTVANLNIDMVGRVDPDHEENENYVYLIGSDKLSSELHELSELANKTYTDIDLDYTYNDENDPNRFYYRSDHYNFAKNNIPIIFYFNGTHDDYHQPTDTVEKINFEMLQKRAQLVFHTAWVLANREDRIVVDKIQDTKVDGQGD